MYMVRIIFEVLP